MASGLDIRTGVLLQAIEKAVSFLVQSGQTLTLQHSALVFVATTQHHLDKQKSIRNNKGQQKQVVMK